MSSLITLGMKIALVPLRLEHMMTEESLSSSRNAKSFFWKSFWSERYSIHVSKVFLPLQMQLKLFPSLADAPVCTTDRIVTVGAFRSENLNVVCEVHADPPPRSFRWKFNSSGESYEISKERHYKNGSQNSVLRYTPVMDQDFGTLTCSGQNEVGEQASPCSFQVILAGKKTKRNLK